MNVHDQQRASERGRMAVADLTQVRNGRRERLLNPVDRVSEILFGLIMAVTIVGALSVATAGAAEVRTVMFAALGCNLAWGLVDAVMYVVRNTTERSRLRTLGAEVRDSDPAGGRRIIGEVLPDFFEPIVGPEEIEAMRQRLLALPQGNIPLLRARTLLEAVGVFAMVVLATFPVVLPFMIVSDTSRAFHYSQATTVLMLFLAGVALGRYAGHPKPLRTGAAMALFGVVLIAAVKALGG
jgi:VIT1/CCC1 family predicted Fe2+/Mn2+ transporter